jgi:phosphohistidine swiveling domain-containing protein
MPPGHDSVNGPRTWLPDPSHYPEQMTPLSATVWFEALGLGLHDAARELGAPFGGFATRTELGWAYEGELEPEWEHDPERLRGAALDVARRWEEELLPRVREITAELGRMRPDLPPPDEAVALLDRLWELVREQWTIHFLVVLPAQIAAELLHDAWVERFGDGDQLGAYRLLEGMDSPADDAVWALAESARGEGVADLLRDLEAEHALARLRGTGPGRRFLRELDGYLERYGGRSRWHELSLPREAELPMLTLEALRLALESGKRPSRQDPPAPPPELEELHAAVRRAYALKELHSYEIDYPGLLATREALRGFGHRLVGEGLLDDVDDVWLLERAELRRALVEPLDLRSIVAERRAELERGRAEGPGEYLGEPPEERERHVALEKFYGSGGGELRGAGASPGVAEGVARVVAGEADFARIRTGDILVTTTTTPAWTPLFPSLAGLVTETGGILSHAAVVAREYRLPAVVGAAGATTAIRDGMLVRIDGAAGTIAILRSSS